MGASPPLNPGDLIWVSFWVRRRGWCTFGLVVAGGRVVSAAPVASWMVGRDEVEIAGYLRRRGAEFTRCGPVTAMMDG